MPTLSSLLVQREVASMRTVEEAIARQVLRGGDLATNILELGVVDEAMLLLCLAESLGLLPAPTGILRPDDPSLLRIVTAELAFRHSIFPLALEGAILHVATSEPLSPAVEEELAFALNVSLKQYAAPLVRIRQAIAACYGIPLDRRMTRLIAKVEGRPDPSPTIPPPNSAEPSGIIAVPMLQPVSIPPPTFGTGLPPASHDTAIIEDAEVQSEASSELPPIPPVPALPRMSVREGRTITPLEVEATPAPPSAGDTFAKEAGDDAEAAQRRAGQFATGGLLNWVRRKAVSEKTRGLPDSFADRSASKLRWKGPFTAAKAEEEMDAATSPDAVLRVFFAFAKQYFEFAFLFVVHPDIAEGREASGPSAASIDAPSVGIPLSLPSTFALAKKRRAPLVTPLADDGIDAEFIHDVRGLPEGSTASPVAAVIPLVVRGHVVAMLYGDDGQQAVDLSAIGDVIAMTALTASALERLILRRKLNALRPAEGAAPAPEQPPFNGLSGPPSGTGARTVPESERLAAARLREVPRATKSRPEEPLRTKSQPEIEVGWDVLPPELVPPARETLPVQSMPGEVHFDEGDTFAGLALDQPLPLLEPPPVLPPPSAAPEEPAAIPPPLRRRPMTSRPIPREDPDAAPAPREEITGPMPDIREARPFIEPPAPASSPTTVGRIRLSTVLAPAGAQSASEPPKPAPPPPDIAALLTQAEQGESGAAEAQIALIAQGEAALPLLMAQFPGLLRADRQRAREQLLPASKCSVLLSILIAIGHPALSPVCARATSSDIEQRFWAVHTLAELPFTDAANTIVPRLFDDDIGVRRMARRAAAKLIETETASAPIIQGLGWITRNIDESVRRRVLAIEAIGEIQAKPLIPPLISALSDPTEDVCEAARRALIGITRCDFGLDVGLWTEWWSVSGQGNRIEWLIDALANGSPMLRRAAADDLLEITGEYVGFHDDMNEEQLARAVEVYRTWWGLHK